MRFSADTDSLNNPPLTESEIEESPPINPVQLPPKRQPHHLVSDVLLEIMGWLAFIDWLVLSDPLRYSRNKLLESIQSEVPGYSLIRATHVCRYWRIVALENRSLWCYIPFSETRTRTPTAIHREFATRVRRSNRLVRGIHVSYTEFPIHEVFSSTRTGPASDSTGPSYILPSGTCVVRCTENEHPGSNLLGSIYDFLYLYPCLAYNIKRCTTLTLKGTGERLTEIFGHLDARDYHFPYYQQTAMLRHIFHSSIPSGPNPSSISALPLLTELTLELVDGTDGCVFPSLPSLRKLTLVRKMASPPLLLPVSPWSLTVATPPATFPVLAEITILVNNLETCHLHHFLIAHANTLTSVTIDTTTDIFNPPIFPGLLHQANFTIPQWETKPLVQVPPYADTRPSNPHGAFVANLHKLRTLSIRHLTPLFSPHVHAWACRALEELELTFPSRLLPPTSFLTVSYTSLRRLIYRFPKNTFTRESWTLALSVDPDPREVNEQGAHSKLLVSLLSKLPTLEELVVDGWVFRHTWGEVDWMEALMPPSAVPLQDYGVEYDLDIIEDDPWNPNRKRKRRSRAERRKERWETQDGRPFSVRDAKISDAGMLLDDTGDILVYAGSEYSSDEGEHPAKAEQDDGEEINHTPAKDFLTASLRLDVASTNRTELTCPRLTRLELRHCFGVERSSMFIFLKERAQLAEESFLVSKVEEALSPGACSGSSRAASSGVGTSPIVDRLDGSSFGAGMTSAIEDKMSLWPSSSAMESCAQVAVMIYDCALTEEELEGLYAEFIRGEYVVRKPRKPQTHSDTA